MESSQKVIERENGVVFSRAIKAGKRIYYLDVRKNKRGELFLTITESRKIATNGMEQPFQFEKHKIFLYKEDFDFFMEGLDEAIGFIKENNTVDFVPHLKKDVVEKASPVFFNSENLEPEIEILEDNEQEITFKLDF